MYSPVLFPHNLFPNTLYIRSGSITHETITSLTPADPSFFFYVSLVCRFFDGLSLYLVSVPMESLSLFLLFLLINFNLSSSVVTPLFLQIFAPRHSCPNPKPLIGFYQARSYSTHLLYPSKPSHSSYPTSTTMSFVIITRLTIVYIP